MKIIFYQSINTPSSIKEKTEKYCVEKGYSLFFFEGNPNSTENLIRTILEDATEEYDYVVYLGSGTYINNFNIEIEDIINEDYLVNLVGQPIFMIVKNCTESFKLFSQEVDFVKDSHIYTFPQNSLYYCNPYNNKESNRIGTPSTFLCCSEDGKNLPEENKYIVNILHSGKYGDILNSLPFLRNLAKKTQSTINYILCNNDYFNNISSLLMKIDYISSVEVLDNQYINYNLDDFRYLYDLLDTLPLPKSYYIIFKEQFDERWHDLGLSEIKPTIKKPKENYSLFSYTGRYGGFFDWSVLLNDFKGNLYFIGTEKEYDFVKKHFDKTNKIKGMLKCNTIMDMFNYMYYCDAYYGSISLITNIGSSIGKPCYVDDGFRNSTVMFENHSYKLINDKNIDLYLMEHPWDGKKSNKKLPLDLIAVDCVDVPRVARAFDICNSYFDYNSTKLLSSIKNVEVGVEITEIEPITSILEYSNFMLGKLNNYIESSHCLVIQHDGFIYDPSLWKDEFLQYDYIGAPVISYDGPEPIQNGGFSLRSKKLMDRISEIFKREGNPKNYSEDYYIFQHRQELEVEGFRFAPVAIAEQFSTEPLYFIKTKQRNSFGFHYFYGHIDLCNGVGIQ